MRHDIAKVGYLADDILTHGGALTHNLESISALEDTRDLVRTATGGLGTYVALVERILAAPKEVKL